MAGHTLQGRPTMLNQRLQALRELVYQTPTPQAWAELWAALEAWPEDESPAVAADYIQQHLERWPDDLRTLPQDWTIPPGWRHTDPRLALLPIERRVDMMDSLITEPFEHIPHHFNEVFADHPRELSILTWRLFRDGRFAPNTSSVHALSRHADHIDAQDFIRLLNHYHQVLYGAAYHTRSVWSQMLENFFEDDDGLSTQTLQELARLWPDNLDERSRAGLGFALVRRGALEATALDQDILERITQHIVHDYYNKSDWLQARGIWPEDAWGQAMADALLQHGYMSVDRFGLANEALPHIDGDARARLINQLMRAAAQTDIHDLPLIIKTLDGIKDEAQEQLDPVIEALTSARHANPDHMRGKIATTLIPWLLLHQPLDPRHDVHLHCLPTYNNHVDLDSPRSKRATELFLKAFARLPQARLQTIFAKWHQHYAAEATHVSQLVLECYVHSGQMGQDALWALMLRLRRKTSLRSYTWSALFKAHQRCGGQPDKAMHAVYKRLAADPHPHPAIFEPMPETWRNEVLTSADPPSLRLLTHFKHPTLAQHLVQLIAARPQKRQDDDKALLGALLAQSHRALNPLRDALTAAKPAARRDLLLDALCALDDDAIAPVLIHLLADTRKNIRLVAANRLQKLPDVAWLPALDKALTHPQRKHRTAVAKAIGLLPESPGLRALVQQHHSTTKDQTLKDALDTFAPQPLAPQSAPTSPIQSHLDALNTLDAETLQALTKDEQHVAKGVPALVALMVRLRAMLSADENLGWNHRQHWSRLCEPHAHDPLLTWVQVEVLALARKSQQDFVWHRFASIPADQTLEDAIVHTLQHRPNCAARNPYYRWLAEHQRLPKHMGLAIQGLASTDATITRWCIKALAKTPAAQLQPVTELLKSPQNATRIAGANLMEAAASPLWLPALQEALSPKRVPAKFRTALEAAQLRAKLAALLESPQNAATDAKLIALFKGVEPGKTTALKPSLSAKALTLHSGASFGSKATGWLIAELFKNRLYSRDAITTRLCNRLTEPSRHTLAKAIYGAYLKGKRPSRERRWVCEAMALLGDAQMLQALASMVAGERKTTTVWLKSTVDLLERRANGHALVWLSHWRRHARNVALKHHANNALLQLADQHNTTLECLLDRTALPGPDHARECWQAHLEDAMITARPWPVSALPDIFQSHVASGVILKLQWPQGQTLLHAPDLPTAIDALPEDARGDATVVVAHPLDVPQEDWDALPDNHATALFAQRRRPDVLENIDLTQPPQSGAARTAYHLHHKLIAHGFAPIVQGEQTSSAVRHFPQDGLSITIIHTGYAFHTTRLWGDPTIGRIIARRSGAEIPWENLPPRVAFEAHRAVLDM